MTTTYYVANNQAIPVRNSTIIIENDKNAVKGALWAFVAFKTGMATLGLGSLTLWTSPLLIFPPFTIVPVAAGLATLFGCSVTNACIQNAGYHLGSRKIVVLQN